MDKHDDSLFGLTPEENAIRLAVILILNQYRKLQDPSEKSISFNFEELNKAWIELENTITEYGVAKTVQNRKKIHKVSVLLAAKLLQFMTILSSDKDADTNK